MLKINHLPDELILKISSNFSSLKTKFNLKLINDEFNRLVDIPFSFKNKFILFCENSFYKYNQIDFYLLESIDKIYTNNNNISICSINRYDYKDYIVNFSLNNVKFDLMLPFSNMHSTTFKIYNKECPERWLWYHNVVKYKNDDDENWRLIKQ